MSMVAATHQIVSSSGGPIVGLYKYTLQNILEPKYIYSPSQDVYLDPEPLILPLPDVEIIYQDNLSESSLNTILNQINNNYYLQAQPYSDLETFILGMGGETNHTRTYYYSPRGWIGLDPLETDDEGLPVVYDSELYGVSWDNNIESFCTWIKSEFGFDYIYYSPIYSQNIEFTLSYCGMPTTGFPSTNELVGFSSALYKITFEDNI